MGFWDTVRDGFDDWTTEREISLLEKETLTSISSKKKSAKKKDTKFERIVNAINEIEPQRLRSEEDLEHQVFQWLKAKKFKVKSQYKTSQGKIDLVVDENIAIELKLADNKANLDGLFGQVRKYKKVFKKIIVVILDVGKVSDLKGYAKDLKKDYGVKVIIIRGEIKRKGGKPKAVININ